MNFDSRTSLPSFTSSAIAFQEFTDGPMHLSCSKIPMLPPASSQLVSQRGRRYVDPVRSIHNRQSRKVPHEVPLSVPIEETTYHRIDSSPACRRRLRGYQS